MIFRLPRGRFGDENSRMPTLTVKAIERAKPRARKFEISCTSVRGLILRVLPSGKKVLLYRQKSSDGDTKVRLGLYGDGTGETITLSVAREQASRLAVLGTAAAPNPSPPPASAAAPLRAEPEIMFSDLAALFMRRHVETEALRDSTRANYRKAISELLLVWGARSLESIRFADVEEFHRSNGHRKSAANNYLRIAHLMFEKAAQWELTERRNPARGVKLFPENKRKRYLSAEERSRLNRVLEEALQRVHRTDESRTAPWARWSHVYAVRLLLLTGMRMSEVLDLEWSWISRERLEIILPQSKTGQSVRPISPAVLDLLDELETYRRPDIPQVVYSKNDRRIHRSSLGLTWGRLRAAAGLEDVRIHDLRHSAASAAINAGCTLKEVSVLLGHRNPKTTARYAHLSEGAGRAAAKRMTDAIQRDERQAPRKKTRKRRKK